MVAVGGSLEHPDHVVDVVLYNLAMGALAAMFAALSWSLEQRHRGEKSDLSIHVDGLEAMRVHAQRLAEGHLHEPIPADGLSAPLEELRVGLQRLLSEVASTTEEVQSAAVELSATATQQASGATEQAAALAEARAMVGDVARGVGDVGGRISEADEAVRQTAARTGELREGLERLVERASVISELLDEVRGIAERTDVLAVNAALEGVRAGEAGKGFGLVAAQVGRLAERVRDAVDELVRLNADVVTASETTQRSMASTGEALGGSLASSSEALAEAERQGLAMGQVARAVEEIATVTQGFAASSQQLQESSAHLRSRVEALSRAMRRFDAV